MTGAGPTSRAWTISTAGIAFILVILILTPLSLADGVPAVPKYLQIDEDPEKVFESIFESRQLAQVEMVNDTHERINLFLSVYSLDPGENLSIIVPLRTLPVDITGEPMEETEFREEFRIAKAEELVVKQDPEEAWGRVGSKAGSTCQFAMGSMLWTMPGEYVRQNFDPDGEWGNPMLAGMITDTDEGYELEVAHYEFDGFSIDVLAVRSGPRLSEFLETRGYAIPDSSVFDAYVDHYVAVVESKGQPPIDPDAYASLQEQHPQVIEALIAELDNETKKTAEDIAWFKQRLIWRYERINHSLRRYVIELVDAVFGRANFTGELLTIDLPLDEGRIFFPLGTSGGWSNEIGDIDVLFKVPEGKDLKIRDSKDAFFEDHHWYLFQMQRAAPDYDLESEIMPGDADRRDEAARAERVYDNAHWIALGITLVLVLTMWFGVAYVIARRKGTDRKVWKDSKLWMLLGAALVISLPGALLLYLGLDPVQVEELRTNFVVNDFMALYLVAAALLVVGVIV